MNISLTKIFFSLSLILSSTACSTSHYLPSTPNIYVGEGGYPDEDIPSSLKTTLPEILFITDRNKKISANGAISYGAKRSASMILGSATIQFGKDISWDELKDQSSATKRENDTILTIKSTKELVRFPETPLPFYQKGSNIVPIPEAQYNYSQAIDKFHKELQIRLDRTQKKEIILFIHGFNNNFTDAGLALADIWHFTGRIGVPIFYTWPAASGGLLGYLTDRESGEFTIYHLKETLRILASMESIDKIHIIAHSRGTDITTTALRELVIETRAKGKKPRDVLKVENLILAAPDLDFGVVQQRLIAERFGPAIGQITVYMNQGDEALGISQYIMSGLRFGKITKDDLAENDQKIFSHIKNVNFIDVKGVSSFVGHSYYRQHSGVLSDIAIALRDNAHPGTKGRPLIHNKINFWTLPESYPNN